MHEKADFVGLFFFLSKPFEDESVLPSLESTPEMIK